jgi:uncharacterized protein (TIGR02594 family)
MITETYTDVAATAINVIIRLIKADGGIVEQQLAQPDGTKTIVARYPDKDPDPIESSGFSWMPIARGELGIHEGTNADRIAEYFAATESGRQPDSVPWCSAFVNFCVQESGQEGTRSARARPWLDWGEEADDFVPGCIVVLPRGGDPSKGHVGFFAGFDAQGNVRLLGGNQHDPVNQTDSVSVHSFPNANENFLGRRILHNFVPAPAPQRVPGKADVRSLLIAAMDRHDIKDNQLRAGIAAICGGESGMKPHSEIGYAHTDPARTRKIFHSSLHDMGDAQILVLAADEAKFFNTVYAGKNGNGDFTSGDGFRYRGRGLIQLTGRGNYERYGKRLQPPVDLVSDPERENDVAIAVETAVVYMLDRFYGGDFAAMKAAVGNSIGPPDANKDQLFREFVASGEFNVA